jgi:hypothetical protein
MKIGVFNIIKKYFALLLVGIVGLLVLNNALFSHNHRLPNGSVVVHAHPFSKSNQPDLPLQSHQHTKFQLLFLDSLLVLFSIGSVYFACLCYKKWFSYKFSYKFSFLENTPQLLTNKAPPSFSFFI